MAERGSVELEPDVQLIVQNAIAAGDFRSCEEMVAEAVRQWKVNHDSIEVEPETLRQKWVEAITANGPYYGLDEVFEPLEKELADRIHARAG